MKTKNGRIKLDPGEKRIGNFIVKEEKEHMKVMDIGQVFTHRAGRRTPVGMFLKAAFDDLSDGKTHAGVGNWLAVMFAAFATVPDAEFLTDVYAASEACMRRHPEAYGMPKDAGTERENAEAEREMREMMEFERDVRDLADGAGRE